MGANTIVADIADVLARRVAAGEYAPGELMPSVRGVADEFDVNRATAQLILGRLEAAGFVEARPGKGFAIRDVHMDGGVELYRRLFELSVDSPEHAVAMFADIVAEEQLLVQDALLAYTDSERTVDSAELSALLDEMETAARSDDPDYAALFAMELALVRKVLTALGHGMQRAMLNSIGDMVLAVPAAVSAFYAVSPDMHVLAWRALVAVWESDAGLTQSQLALFGDIFGVYHVKVLARFDELLLGSPDSIPDRRATTA
ncbi:MAG: GntR family transcriptional regulator [Mycobacteriaceae bacterium]|nr:GntR family transcriptional regulator [Mycobacteriaceae bacterium]